MMRLKQSPKPFAVFYCTNLFARPRLEFFICLTKIMTVHQMEFNCLPKEITSWIRVPLKNTTVCLEPTLVPAAKLDQIILFYE